MNSQTSATKNFRTRLREFWFNRLYEWRYFIILGVVYGTWKGYKEIYYRSPLLTGIGNNINDVLSLAYIKCLEAVARISAEAYSIGEITKGAHNFYYIRLAGSDGVYIGWHCLAVPAMVVFSGSILMFRGKPTKKILYVLFGNIVICCANLFRLAGLMFMEKYSSENFFKFNHSYTYLVLTYAVVFLLIIYYVRKLEPPLHHHPTA